MPLNYQTWSIKLWFYGNDSDLKLHSSAFEKAPNTPIKYKQCHMNFRGLSSVWAKLELVRSENNDILEINVLEKFISHALYFQSGTRNGYMAPEKQV